ncbi:hypothetical protein CK203_111574 [Vitis vinifera]|uniref:Uncharacterized protein n=1 Tax=Vitis vinifera TaxID=29760 RepID=A0A438C947_VITVI|nr:hypothetical protein CK203_111574 [Vitis vinifera]
MDSVDSEPYYQSMIDTIAEVGPGIKGPTGYQIGNTYLEDEVQKLEEVIKRLKLDLDRQAKAINEVKLFVDGQGEFGSALTKKAINQSLLGFPSNEEGRETVHEDDGATNRRVDRRTSNATQERDIDSCRKGKAPRTISSSSSSDDGDNRAIGGVGVVEELVALVRVLEEMVALRTVMLVK